MGNVQLQASFYIFCGSVTLYFLHCRDDIAAFNTSSMLACKFFLLLSKNIQIILESWVVI